MSETTGATGAAPSSGASPAATASPAPAAAPPASATATPAASGETTAAPASPSSSGGEPPRERWDSILENTRTKTRSEVEAEYRTKYGWVDEFQGNPYPYLDQWLDQVSAHPEMGPKLLAKAARMLQSRRGQSVVAPEEPPPDVPIQDATGNVVSHTYSATQLKKWAQWNQAQQESALSERLSPLEQLKTKIEKAEADAQRHAMATTVLTRYRDRWSWFKEHEPAIKQFYAEHEEYGDNLAEAAADYFEQHIRPTLSQTEQAKVLDHLQTQANGATVHPSGSQVSGPPKFKSFREASEYYSKHPDEAARMANR